MFIRPARAGDRDRLYEVCLRTGASGQDATTRYADPLLPGHVYVGPYLALEPDLAFVLDEDGDATGYVLGARDTIEFERRCEQDWWPTLRKRYPDPPVGRSWTPDESLCHLIHHPPSTDPAVAADYPAHLHVDLLPRAQGSGNGRRLVEHLLSHLRAVGVHGVHLGVGAENERAIGFYHHLGLRTVRREPGALLMGMRFTPRTSEA
ncbi:MAG: GNAT family N-acetyltransferase [Jiangellaceae bacterium]